MYYSNVCLNTFAYSLPPLSLTSSAIETQLEPLYKRLKLPLGRLELMSGVRERRLWEPGTLPSDGAIRAGKELFAKGVVTSDQIECLIFSSVSRDMAEPATASFVHNSLGLPQECLVFDLSNACLGFLDGMIMLANMIELGQVKNGLVVAGETAEALIKSTIKTLLCDKKMTRKSIKPAFASLTIGSGSVALYMCRQEKGMNRPRLVHGAWRANTSHSNLCQGGQNVGNTTLMNTNSEELLIRGVETAKKTWETFSGKPGWQAADIDRFFCHQVGSAHAKLLFESLELDPEKNFETLDVLGNVGSVSAPITMAMAIEQMEYREGQKGAILGIGSGINCLMLGVEW